MFNDFSNIILDDPGYQTNLNTMEMPIKGPMQSFVDGNPVTLANWEKKVAKFTNNGLHPTATTTPEYLSDNSIVYTYTIYPWEDKTHLQIQEYMLVFVNKALDRQFKLFNMAPIYQLNIIMNKKYSHFKNANTRTAEATELERLLQIYGEQGLKMAEYTADNPLGTAAELAELKRHAEMPDLLHVTRHGILMNWNFCGAVVSKGESTGAFSYVDHHENSQMTSVVGVVVGQRARINNIWGEVKVGDKLYLILTKPKGKNTEFQWVPYCNSKYEYPIVKDYTDESGRKCRPFIQYIGICTENKDRTPTKYQRDVAIGLFGNMQQAYEIHGNLPCIQVQIGV